MSVDAVLKTLDKIEGDLKQKLEIIPELSDRLMQLEQKRGALREGPTGGVSTPGMEFARKLAESGDLFAKTGRIALDVETKGLVTGAQVGARASLGPTGGPAAVTETMLSAMLNLLPGPGTAALIYPRRIPQIPEGEGGAVQAGEGALKSESTPIYQSITQPQATIACFANLTEQAIRSSAELQVAVDLHLKREVMLALDRLLLGGTTVTASAFAGLIALAPTGTFLHIGVKLEQVITSAALAQRVRGYQPSIVVVNPADWQAVITRTSADGQYINGSVFTEGPMVISGMRVAMSPYIDQQHALLIDGTVLRGDAVRSDARGSRARQRSVHPQPRHGAGRTGRDPLPARPGRDHLRDGTEGLSERTAAAREPVRP